LRSSPNALVLRQARQHLLEHGDVCADGLDAFVARSWQRSLAAGLQPVGRVLDTAHANGAGLRESLVANQELLAHSQPVMEALFQLVRDSQGMVILADKHGMLMHTLGHADFLGKAERVALSCGASWHEQHRGTNAIGTALTEARGIEIHGAEHFLERNDFLTCTAAPIRSAQGHLLGVLDISGDQRSGPPHTLGLVSMAACMIENRLITTMCQQQIRLHLHSQLEGLGTVAEGIVVLSNDAWVVGGNCAGLALLRLSTPDLGVARLENLLDVSLDELLSRHQRRPGQASQVRRSDGSILFVLLEQAQRTWTSRPASQAASVADRSPLNFVKDALAQLDTGDARWRTAADKARRVLDKSIPLLIQGESGVGKELFARAVHNSGARRNQPFVAINCAAVPENLIEAELFGYAAGAFTGARREGSPGRLREAHGGTLFLDEIGDMPLAMQARLLRVLQERQVSPLGGGPLVAVDFALICATHSKLREAAELGQFRSDLFYRINGLTLILPPLRERTDFQVLTQRLLADLNPGRSVVLAAGLLQRLSQHPWPGNLRQYANALRTASAMLDAHEHEISWSHLPDDLAEDLAAAERVVATQRAPHTKAPALSHNLQALSRAAIDQALQSSHGNISEAAKQLGISRQTLYRKLA